MKIERLSYFGANKRESLYELSSRPMHQELVLFIHGFMGFMDWGAWHLVRDYFTGAGYDFCRFNLSHNGGTIANPMDFPDEEAFGQNTYSKELFDISGILNQIASEHRPYNKIHLIGHSRGGGMAILAAQQWQQISSLGQVCTWAAICDIERRFPIAQDLKKWEETGVRFVMTVQSISSEIQKLAPSSVIELFVLDLALFGQGPVRFHAGTNALQQRVVWQGNSAELNADRAVWARYLGV